MCDIRSALSGVKKGEYRDNIEELIGSGWSAEKTNGNHLKLLHPEASTPVFASSTPSCRRSSANLKAQCKRVLMDTAATFVPVGQTSDKKISKSDPFAKNRKKHRWSRADREKHRFNEEKRMFEEKLKAEKALKKAEMKTTKKDEKIMTTQTQTADQKTNGQTAVIAAMASQNGAGKDLNVHNQKHSNYLRTVSEAAPVQPKTTPVTAERENAFAKNAEITMVDAATLELAMRIQSGEMRPVAITAEMVGQTLWVSGDMAMSPSMPAMAATATPEVKAKPVAEKATRKQKLDETGSWILQGASKTEWRTAREVIEMAPGGEDLNAADREPLRQRILRMETAGLLDMKKMKGNRRLNTKYRLPA